MIRRVCPERRFRARGQDGAGGQNGPQTVHTGRIALEALVEQGLDAFIKHKYTAVKVLVHL